MDTLWFLIALAEYLELAIPEDVVFEIISTNILPSKDSMNWLSVNNNQSGSDSSFYLFFILMKNCQFYIVT